MNSAGQTGSGQAGRGNAALFLALAAFAVFLVNAVVGKASLLLGASTPVHMGNVPEFALLVFATACFVVAILERERAQPDESVEPLNQREEGTP